MSNVYGAGPSPPGFEPLVTQPMMLPTPQLAAPPPLTSATVAAAAQPGGLPPDAAANASAVAGATNPLVGALLNMASALGINPLQLASVAAQDPDAVADVLDTSGVPAPGTVPATGPDVGTALADVNAPVSTSPSSMYESEPGMAATATEEVPVAGTGTDVGVVPTRQAAPPTGSSIGDLLSGIRPPDTPTPPALGNAGVPNPSALRTSSMDEIIRSALAVATPQSQGLTLQNALRRPS